MISDIVISNQKIIKIVFDPKNSKNINKIASSINELAVFSDVKHTDMTILISEDSELNYDQISQLMNLFFSLNLISDQYLSFKMLSNAWKNLHHGANALCGYRNELNYEIIVSNDLIMTLLPINPLYKNFTNNEVKELVNAIKKQNILYFTTTNFINLPLSNKSTDEITEAILNIFVDLKIIEIRDKDKLYNKIIFMFFKKMAKNEINSLNDITDKSIDHPLSKYKVFAEELGHLLYKTAYGIPIDANEFNKLKKMITRKDEFSMLPEIFTKNIGKISKNIDKVLNKVIRII